MQNYLKAFTRFVIWAYLNGMSWLSYDVLDDLVIDYADAIISNRGDFSLLISALHFVYPRVKGKLVASYAYRAGWLKSVSVNRTVPMLKSFTYGIAKEINSVVGARMAIGLLVQYEGLLRTAELIAIRKRNVVLPEWHGYCNRYAYITLDKTKSGREQVVCIRDVYVVAALRYVVSVTAAPDALLFNRTYQQYYDLLSEACKRLGLGHLRFTPHSPRAGGATQRVMDGEAFSEVQESGRWKCAESLRIYLDRAKALATGTITSGCSFLNLLAQPNLIGNIFLFSPINP